MGGGAASGTGRRAPPGVRISDVEADLLEKELGGISIKRGPQTVDYVLTLPLRHTQVPKLKAWLVSFKRTVTQNSGEGDALHGISFDCRVSV